ncbi:MAG: hypothetical protein ACD_28C00327G0005 [uncultured bacterium]|nr:MAG: hypothetical protein ACD_28C00327G0005 [uncultured bacterium]KKT75463.1 MAG: Preprotein translocase subunit YidC [Candidatus Peregrinibacteria bacterium GW2011_GWA2_44_7]
MKNRFFIWILLVFTAFTLVQNWGKGQSSSSLDQNDVGLITNKTEYTQGAEVIVTIQNNTTFPLEIPENCPVQPLGIKKYANGEWIDVSIQDSAECKVSVPFEIKPGEKSKLSYKNWAYRLFETPGRYRVEGTILINQEPRVVSTNEFTITEKGVLKTAWMNFVYRPILNALVYLIEVLPGHSLGFSIIFLTLIIRTLLLIPSQKAMKSQKKLQKIQSRIEELKKKHKDNQEKLAMETVALWKEHKVNPFGSCLMILIQFPILIALYLVVSQGLHPDKSSLLYEQIGSNLSFETIQTHFLGLLDLTQIDFFVLPLLVGALQFIQIHLALSRQKKKKAEKELKKEAISPEKVAKNLEKPQDFQDQMQMANNMMKYVMPLMIAFFTASLPAGVGLYWGTSTIYGIAQQFVVNKQSEKEEEEEEPSVRVIEK